MASSSSRTRSHSREPLLRNGLSMDSVAVSLSNDAPAALEGGVRVDEAKAERIKKILEDYEKVFGIDEDAFDQPTTTRWELWSFYLYCNGDNGVGPGSYSQALFQSALSGDGWDPSIVPIRKGNCTTGGCVVAWGSSTRAVSSVVLIANGICFTIMTVIFVALGSAADYGTFGRWLLLFLTVVYGMIAIREPNQWPTAMGLYIISYISYGVSTYHISTSQFPDSLRVNVIQATLVFFSALFPRLARYMPHVRKAREEDLKDGKISQDEYDNIESMERNHISNISTAHSNIGYLLTLAISLSVLLPLQGDKFANNLALCLTNSYWLVLGIPWFIFAQKRPGPSLPKGSSYLTIGWKQVYLSLREIRHLPQTFIYLLAFFLLADGLNTTSTLVSLIQNEVISFSFLQLTYLGLSQAATSTFSTFGFWYIQQYFGIRTKTMFMVTNLFSVLIPLYGVVGLWSDKVGYHHVRDFWLYNIVFGLFQAPYYA
ncbi:Major facilitator superfamily domain general substrate transporter protein [Rutstroemia sp. NJR-2017a BBW]|nr:Major facilitator superfamily domain general substrate transporter protein [Rutstroemia sp. NJR-2017a BBW]